MNAPQIFDIDPLHDRGMIDELIHAEVDTIKLRAGRVLLILRDGRAATAGTIGEALALAEMPDAINVRQP